MIDYSQLAQEAGFGGVMRRTMASRIKTLVDLAMHNERLSCARLCDERGDYYRTLSPNDFHEGKMDGAYSCADLIRNRK